jgi:hypothetical protein
MMSTALLMAVGGEQMKLHTAASDRVEGEETSFAQSLGERVGLSTNVQTRSSGGDALRETQGEKISGQLKRMDAAPVASAGVKVSVAADQGVTELDEPKDAATPVVHGTDKSLPADTDPVMRADVSDRGQPKTTPGQLPVDRGELQQKIEPKTVAQAAVSHTETTRIDARTAKKEQPLGDVEHSEVSAVVSNDAPPAESATVESVPLAGVVAADRLPLSRDAIQPQVQKEAVPTGKSSDVGSVKKEVKAQGSEVGTKAALKTAGMTESGKTAEGASIVTGAQSAIPLPIQVSAPREREQSAVGATVADVTGVLGTTAGKLAAGTSTASTESTGRKALVQVGKDEGETTGQVVSPAVGTTAATGSVAEIAKAAVSASTVGKDADAKGLGAVGAAAMAHTVAGNETVASGIVSGLASGHTPTEISGPKMQAGESVSSAGTVRAGLGEQDGSGVVAAETGMSHRTLLATPTALEVGLANGTQGWLKIRAEMTDGGIVNASLSSATPAGQEMLHRELPALTAYLQEERVAVNTIVVPASVATGPESRFAGGMSGEGSGQAQQGGRQGGGDDRQGSIHGVSDHAEEIPAYVGLNGVGEEELYSPGTYTGGGSWLNVRA